MSIFSHKLLSFTLDPMKQFTVDTTNFIIEQCDKVGNVWVSVVRYPSCDNYEGRKVLVTRVRLSNAFKTIDPHFSPDNPIGLIARFEPTEAGIQLAKKIACLIPPP